MHDLGPEIRRAISGNLDEEEYIDKEIEEPMHRVGSSYNLGHTSPMIKTYENTSFGWYLSQNL